MTTLSEAPTQTAPEEVVMSRHIDQSDSARRTLWVSVDEDRHLRMWVTSTPGEDDVHERHVRRLVGRQPAPSEADASWATARQAGVEWSIASGG